MSSSLYETLARMDRYVKLNDGLSIRTVEQILFTIDVSDHAEYVLGVDPRGRFLIYRLDPEGNRIRPPVYVEEKLTWTMKEPEVKPS